MKSSFIKKKWIKLMGYSSIAHPSIIFSYGKITSIISPIIEVMVGISQMIGTPFFSQMHGHMFDIIPKYLYGNQRWQ